MHQIMVIQDLGLWSSLNRGFARSRSVTLTEAATWEQALVLAAVERPDVVVCSGRGLGISPGQLAGEFKARQISGIHIVCTVEDEYGAADPAPDSQDEAEAPAADVEQDTGEAEAPPSQEDEPQES